MNRMNREEGQVLLLMALLMGVILGFSALAVDVGFWLHARTKLQADADAMALAAALELPNASNAETIAREWATKNDVQTAEITDISVNSRPCNSPGPAQDYVTVRLSRHQKSYLAQAVGIAGARIEVCATARKFELAGFAGGLRPWGLEDTCIANVTYGSSVTLKYGSGDSGDEACGATTGNFGALAIDGNGANAYRTTIKNGSTSPLCADSVPGCQNYTVSTETGNMVGPTGQGIDYLIANTPASCRTWAQVSDGMGGITPSCNPWLPGYSGSASLVVIMPVVHGLWSNGKHDVTVKRFAMVFLSGYESCGNGNGSCQVDGYFIKSTLTIPGSRRVSPSQDSTITGIGLAE
jgi:Flp pilus assembly protein TadG